MGKAAGRGGELRNHRGTEDTEVTEGSSPGWHVANPGSERLS